MRRSGRLPAAQQDVEHHGHADEGRECGQRQHAALAALFLLARPLNALLLGTDYAANLGIGVKRVRTWLLLLAGLLTASVTALCGPIAFIGLAVPHAARLLLRTADHRRLLPATLLLGADVALLALILTHLPGERGVLPLAALTPLIGVPVVLYILLRRG